MNEKNQDAIDALSDIDISLRQQTEEEPWWENMHFELKYFWDNKIMYPIRSFNHGVSNLIKYRKLIWRDRWWDYNFMLEMLLFKLKDMEEHWVKDTHYVNDTDEKETLQKLIEDLEWLVNEDRVDDFAKDKEGNSLDIKEQYRQYHEEYKRRSRSFFGRLDRNHRKLWD